MKHIMFLWLLLGLGQFVSAQTVTIVDKESGEPVEQVVLMSETPRIYTITDDRGQADVSEFETSEAIEIGRMGYSSVILSFTDLQKSSFKVVLTPQTVNMGQVVVSATRWEQKSDEVASKIITISPRDVAFYNPQTAADLLGSSGKVFIQKSQQGGGSPMIRGFATNRLVYTVDGVRMNTAIFRGGNIQNVISLDPFAIEQTEVLFGPGSVVYGSDAIGGVMSFTTLQPQLSLNNKTRVSGGSAYRTSSANNEVTAHVHTNIGWKRWALVTSISSNEFGDLRMGSNGPDDYLRPHYVKRIDSTDVVVSQEDPRVQTPSGYSQINMMQKLRFKPNANWDFQYGLHYSETSGYARYDRHQRIRNGLPRYAEWSYGPQKWLMNNLQVKYHGENKLFNEMSLRLAHQAFEESRISRNLNRVDREIQLEEVTAYSVNLDFVKSKTKKNKLFYGIEAVTNDVTSTGTVEDISTGEITAGPSRYPKSTWSSYAAYVSNHFQATKRLLVQAGLRYNQFGLNADFDTTYYPFPFTEANLANSAVTGSLGFVLKAQEDFIIRLNFGTAFRSPNVDDIGKVFDSEPGAVTVPNPDLEAEYAYNGDLGFVKIFGDVLKVDVTGYYTYLKNALTRRDFTLNGEDSIMYSGVLSQVQAIQNAAQASVYGVQASVEVKLGSGFSFVSNLNYQKGIEELDDGTESSLRHAAPTFGESGIHYRSGKLRLELYSQYCGEVSYDDLPESEKGKTEIYAADENGNPYSPSWTTLNFKSYYKFANHFALSAGIENITDQRYRSYSSGLSAPGRNFIFSMRIRF